MLLKNRRAERFHLGHYSTITTGQLHPTAHSGCPGHKVTPLPCSVMPGCPKSDSLCSVSHGPAFGWDRPKFLLSRWYCAVL